MGECVSRLSVAGQRSMDGKDMRTAVKEASVWLKVTRYLAKFCSSLRLAAAPAAVTALSLVLLFCILDATGWWE